MENIYVVILILLGLAMVCVPKTLWKIEHLLSVKNGEPTELYIGLMRVTGALFMVVGIICFVVGLKN